MASGYPNSGPHGKFPRDPWDKQWDPAPKVKTVTLTPSLPSIFSDQFFIGFTDQIQRWQPWTLKKPTSFPPYNLIKIDDDTYSVELAVAGYGKDDIAIEVEKDLLTVKSVVEDSTNSKTTVIHQGIAERDWSQQFILGEYMEVTDADLKDGLLTIKVERKLPEELKPKKIAIN